MNSDKEKKQNTPRIEMVMKNLKRPKLQSQIEKKRETQDRKQIDKTEKGKNINKKEQRKLKESSQVDDRDPLESRVDRIWVIRLERVLDRADDPRE